MARKVTLSMDLNSASIADVRRKIERYASLLDYRCSMLLDRLGEIGRQSAASGFAGAQYDGVNDVTVHMERVAADTIRIVANGEAVAFIEFGTGITMGGGHPTAGMLGFGPGTYPGKGHWNNPKGWTYYGEAGSHGVWVKEGLYRTKGNPPAMAMANATEAMVQQVMTIAQEVFDTW